eukprot:gnl/TRDRNA2_/TRDRNA2_181841_c0_seq1.p1 gnl/TRDRNA2_/TRDRNA2_181841_c0~~gnl/TRDRNA2_/TRDRNA2_181841_c0_seq1.p1  ORF type:complete len:389 (-),score=86.48 gnl/TRDRNA2_/TRDRNA2_181841_c0_seq1:214-1380(-)
MAAMSETPPLVSTQRVRSEGLSRSRIQEQNAKRGGQRGTIYWVGKAIIGEDGSDTGTRSKGASYHGEWGDDKKNGYGVQIYPNGNKYEGSWSNGKRNGEGVLWVPLSKSSKLRKLYVGGWKDDKRHGKGTCFFKNGEFFQGTWEDGMMQGEGTLRYANGDLYLGEWHQGQRSGKGTLTKANGDCYEGFWLADKREGSGSHFYAASGKVFVGEWANDLPKSGVYTQAHPNPEQAAAVPMTSVLPSVRLALPTEVLEGALSCVREARKAYRAKSTPVGRLFAEDELQALRQAFFSVQKSDGTITLTELQALLAALGMDVALSRLQRHVASVGLDADVEAALGLDDFLRIVALLLDEEAALNPDMSAQDPRQDLGEEGYDDFEGQEDGLEP